MVLRDKELNNLLRDCTRCSRAAAEREDIPESTEDGPADKTDQHRSKQAFSLITEES